MIAVCILCWVSLVSKWCHKSWNIHRTRLKKSRLRWKFCSILINVNPVYCKIVCNKVINRCCKIMVYWVWACWQLVYTIWNRIRTVCKTLQLLCCNNEWRHNSYILVTVAPLNSTLFKLCKSVWITVKCLFQIWNILWKLEVTILISICTGNLCNLKCKVIYIWHYFINLFHNVWNRIHAYGIRNRMFSCFEMYT